MLWVIIIVVVLVVIVAIAAANASTPRSPRHTPSRAHGRKIVVRRGKATEADSVFEAWTSGELHQMLAQLDQKTTLVDRHFLLMSIVGQTYKDRANPDSRDVCRKVAELHLQEFPRIEPALKKSVGGFLPRVPTVQQYATVLTDDGEYDRAIEVCEKALEFGLSDGTGGDYEGRIERIRRKRDKPKRKAARSKKPTPSPTSSDPDPIETADIRFTCPHCQQSLEAPPAMAGAPLDCPTCSGSLVVPAKTDA